jgi:outer membrane protein
MLGNRLTALALAALGLFATAASAADLRGTQGPEDTPPDAGFFFVHLGPAGLVLDEGAEIYAGGYRIPGGDISVKSHVTFAAEVGYYFTPNIAVSFTGGFPPNVKIEADGSMDGLGRVGATTYGPMTVTAHYHFTGLGRLQPYVGIGPAFMYVFDSKDGLMGTLNIDHAMGVAFQVGADYMINDHWGVFVDVKKAILRTEATGFLGAAPIRTDIKLDPLVLHTGVTYRF